MIDLEERFWSKVDATGDCWEWTASRNGDGYGYIKIDGRNVPVTHIAWELLVGPIPPGLEPDHLCRNPPCVNVGNHIEWVTRYENGRRSQSLPARNARKTHCPRGHAYTEDNIYRLPGNPARYCKACHKIRTAEINRKRRADPEKAAIDRERNRLRMLGYRDRHPKTPEQHARIMELQRQRRAAARDGIVLRDLRKSL